MARTNVRSENTDTDTDMIRLNKDMVVMISDFSHIFFFTCYSMQAVYIVFHLPRGHWCSRDMERLTMFIDD
jgi:hypothetical protein